MQRAYLDHAATTPLAPEVRAAMEPWLAAGFGNPSSRHRLGVEAAEAVDAARRAVARAVGARAEGVVFTSGGTEANNLAVLGFARARSRKGRHVLVGATEHASVRAPAEALRAEGFEVEALKLDAAGELDLEHLDAHLRPDTVLVAQMLVSNEFGSIYPVERAARLVRAKAPQAAFHVDAVQALGKLELSIAELGATSLALSAHKVHGPKGAGALVLAAGARPPAPIVHGGGQEHGLRSGTENVAAIVGFGRAAELAEARRELDSIHLAEVRARFRALLEDIPGARAIEPGSRVVPSIVCVYVAGAPAEVVLHHLDARGVHVGAGSACQARKREISPAFAAIGLDAEEARHCLRFSFGGDTTLGEVERAVTELAAVVAELAPAGERRVRR